MFLIYCTRVLQGMELPKSDESCTALEMDSLKQDVQHRDEEIIRLAGLLKTKEEVTGNCGGGGGGGEGESSHVEVEASDVRAMLEEEKDKKMKAEEELKTLQVCGTWLPP